MHDFKSSLILFNHKEARQFDMNIGDLEVPANVLRQELKIDAHNRTCWQYQSDNDTSALMAFPRWLIAIAGPRRVSFAPTASEIMLPERCMAIPLFLPSGFAKYANDAVRKALADHDLPSTADVITSAFVPGTDVSHFAMRGLEPVLWDIDVISAWQQIDRRIDEYGYLVTYSSLLDADNCVCDRVFEVLWSFHRAQYVCQSILKVGACTNVISR